MPESAFDFIVLISILLITYFMGAMTSFVWTLTKDGFAWVRAIRTAYKEPIKKYLEDEEDVERK